MVADKKTRTHKSVLPVGNIKSEEFKNSSLFIIDDKLKFIFLLYKFFKVEMPVGVNQLSVLMFIT